MNMPRRVGHNPPIPGEIHRLPEVGAAGLLRCDLKWMAYVSEMLPTFCEDNAPDRTGQAWCSCCGWKPVECFAFDKARSRKQGQPVLERRCKPCDAKRKADESKERPKWKRGSAVKRGRPKRPTTVFISDK
jgi:hypothetical protein